MIEIDPNNPPEKFQFTLRELFTVLGRLGDDSLLSDRFFLECVKSILQRKLKSQIDVWTKDGNVVVTLYQPTPQDYCELLCDDSSI